MLERISAPVKKLLLYAVCGGCGVLLDLAVFATLLGAGLWYQTANLAGYASGTLLSFVLNRAFTFQVKDAPLRRLALFLLVAAIGFSLSTALLWLLVERLSIEPLYAKAISLVVVLVTQFSLNSFITFRAQAPNRARRSPLS